MNGTNSYQQPQQLLTSTVSRISQLEQSVEPVELFQDITDIEIKAEPLLLENEEVEENEEKVHQEGNINAEILAELRKINQRLDNVESLLLGHTSLIDRTPKKPSVLPMKTTDEVLQFNTVDEEIYQTVVQYLGYLGGSSIRESVNLCIKETLSGECVCQFTWLGRDIGRRPICIPLFNTRLAHAILEATTLNRHYPAPTKTEFASHMKEALRVAKQRTRNQLLSKKRRTTDDEEDF